MDLLVFYLEGHRYGVRLEVVQEVVRAVWPAPLPGAPAVVEGVIDYRGALVPVLDLRSRFSHPPKPLEPSDQLIVARAGARLVAVRTDRAGWPVQVAPEALEDLAAAVGPARYVAGVARLPDGLIVIHDLTTFLTADESAQLADSLAGEKVPRG